MVTKITPESAGKLEGLNLNPEDIVGDYKKSKEFSKLATSLKSFLPHLIHESLESSIIKTLTYYEDTLEAQKHLIENFDKHKAIKDERIARLYQMGQDLRQRFIEVNDSVKENEFKQMIAEQKIRKEMKLHESLTKEIETLATDVETLETFHKEFEQNLKKIEPYETVINEVVEGSDIFSTVEDCIKRCDALMLSQDEITNLQKKVLEDTADVRLKFDHEVAEVTSKILGINNELTEFEQNYSNSRDETFKWENILKQARDLLSINELDHTRILNGIQQLYALLRTRNNLHPHGRRENYEKLLDYIKNEAEILKQVVSMCEQGSYRSKFGRMGSKTTKTRHFD